MPEPSPTLQDIKPFAAAVAMIVAAGLLRRELADWPTPLMLTLLEGHDCGHDDVRTALDRLVRGFELGAELLGRTP